MRVYRFYNRRYYAPRMFQACTSIIKIVDFIKEVALNSPIFKQFCTETDADCNMLLFYTNIRWLSNRSVTNSVFDLGGFFEEHRKINFFFIDE